MSATFGAGVAYRRYDAAQRPIACPNRRKQPERYATFMLDIIVRIRKYKLYIKKTLYLDILN
jgi:hypothetical protein